MARTKEDAKADKASAEATPRGRGRPKKATTKKATTVASGGVKKAYVPTGRPRGRPKSDNPKTKPYVPTGRPRGRPPGSGKKKTGAVPKSNGVAAAAATAATPKATPKAAAKATPKTTPKTNPKTTPGSGKRGRPRKSDASDAPVAKETATPKRKRGRPPKKSLEAEVPEDDLVRIRSDVELDEETEDGDNVDDVAQSVDSVDDNELSATGSEESSDEAQD